MIMTIMAGILAATPITTPGPVGDIHGTLIDAGNRAPAVLIIPGSGPTDRDGNNPMGVKAAPYRLLAESLAERGISSIRADKRGQFASKEAIADANAVTLSDYAEDAHGWARTLRARTGASCVWLVGHSEGGLVALNAAQDPTGICGVVLIASPGRKMGDLLREQLRANPANAPLLESALAAIAALEDGRRVDVTGMNPALLPLFAPQVQGYLIDLMAADPARLAAKLTLPLLIVHGGEDLQVVEADAKALHAAQPKSRLIAVPGMNHVLKVVPAGDRAANFAAYADPSLPLAPDLVDAIAAFVTKR